MKSERVGVRELRQNLSRYLRRVGAGERFEVTERNLPVAILAPLPGDTTLGRLVAEGRAVPARLELRRLGAPMGAIGTRISDALAEQRQEG
jgi:prevent-host-death family protein